MELILKELKIHFLFRSLKLVKNKLLGAEADMAKRYNEFLIGCNVNQ